MQRAKFYGAEIGHSSGEGAFHPIKIQNLLPTFWVQSYSCVVTIHTHDMTYIGTILLRTSNSRHITFVIQTRCGDIGVRFYICAPTEYAGAR